MDVGGTCLPWADREGFAALMLAWEMRSYQAASALSVPVIFDRGIPDVIGYLRLCGLPVPNAAIRAAKLRRYAKCVFIAPTWPEIFTQDAERKQNLVEAHATYDAMAEVYSRLGYDLVPLHLVTVAERVQFIQSQIAN